VTVHWTSRQLLLLQRTLNIILAAVVRQNNQCGVHTPGLVAMEIHRFNDVTASVRLVHQSRIAFGTSRAIRLCSSTFDYLVI